MQVWVTQPRRKTFSPVMDSLPFKAAIFLMFSVLILTRLPTEPTLQESAELQVSQLETYLQEAGYPVKNTKVEIRGTEDFYDAGGTTFDLTSGIAAYAQWKEGRGTIVVAPKYARNPGVIAHEMAHQALFTKGFTGTDHHNMDEFRVLESCLAWSLRTNMNLCSFS